MSRLTILRGISGSGKSTWAETMQKLDHNVVIVSRDKIRMALFGTEDFIDEDYITRVEHNAVREALAAGRDVISDNTNIRPRYIKPIANIGYEFDAEVSIKQFDIELEQAVSNNNSRAKRGGRDVPAGVIYKQYQAMKGNATVNLIRPPQFQPYVNDWSKPHAILFDLDNTLAIKGDRGPYEEDKVDRDLLDRNLAYVLGSLAAGGEHDIIGMSGRHETCREMTEQWLRTNGVYFSALYMRGAEDNRPDWIVKSELLDEHIIPYYNIICAFDDRRQVVDHYRKRGVPVYEVRRGDF